MAVHHQGTVVVALNLVVFFTSSCTVAREVSPKQVAGFVEKALLYPGGLEVRAKLDSGAKNSSLHARDIEYLRHGDADWLRFKVTNRNGETATFKRRVIRSTKIKRHFGRAQVRPVINLGICLGASYKEAEVNLVDRSGFHYQMLLGRSFLKGGFLIDPEKRFTLNPTCVVKP